MSFTANAWDLRSLLYYFQKNPQWKSVPKGWAELLKVTFYNTMWLGQCSICHVSSMSKDQWILRTFTKVGGSFQSSISVLQSAKTLAVFRCRGHINRKGERECVVRRLSRRGARSFPLIVGWHWTAAKQETILEGKHSQPQRSNVGLGGMCTPVDLWTWPVETQKSDISSFKTWTGGTGFWCSLAHQHTCFTCSQSWLVNTCCHPVVLQHQGTRLLGRSWPHCAGL